MHWLNIKSQLSRSKKNKCVLLSITTDSLSDCGLIQHIGEKEKFAKKIWFLECVLFIPNYAEGFLFTVAVYKKKVENARRALLSVLFVTGNRSVGHHLTPLSKQCWRRLQSWVRTNFNYSSWQSCKLKVPSLIAYEASLH